MLFRVEASPRSKRLGGASTARPWRRALLRALAVAVVVLLLPVPWQHKADSGLGVAWGMDNRLVVEGERLDPSGRYSWLTAGRPPIVGELVWNRLVRLFDPGAPPAARDLRVGDAAHRPVYAEPMAAAVGRAAAANGGIVPAIEIEPIDAVIGGHGPPYSWFRKLSMGSSHSMMVGLVTYAATAGEDLAAGRHVAGTGRLFRDGTVGGIGGLQAKASGARRAGVDVLLVPAVQRDELDGVDLGGMHVLGVSSLDDAIVQLRATRDLGWAQPGS